MSDISRLVVAWVSAQQRHYRQSTRGIATVEQRLEWEREAEGIIAAHDREVAAGALRDAARIVFAAPIWPFYFLGKVLAEIPKMRDALNDKETM